MRIANLISAGEFWRRISERMEQSAANGPASVETYDAAFVSQRGTSLLSLTMTDMAFVSAGLRASEAGCDALFVNAVPDYGVPLLRASVSIPVIGAGESSMLLARSMGERFSIVTVWQPSSAPMYDRLLAQTGMGESCASVVYTLSEDEYLVDRAAAKSALQSVDETLVDRLERSCRRAFEEDGADSVILGCTCMHPIASALAGRFDRPVIDPVMVGWRFAEMAAEAASIGRRPVSGAPPEHRDAFLAMTANAAQLSVELECTVCEAVAAVGGVNA